MGALVQLDRVNAGARRQRGHSLDRERRDVLSGDRVHRPDLSQQRPQRPTTCDLVVAIRDDE